MNDFLLGKFSFEDIYLLIFPAKNVETKVIDNKLSADDDLQQQWGFKKYQRESFKAFENIKWLYVKKSQTV